MKYVGSYHQERIWFIDAFERGSLYEGGPVYHNIPLILYAKDGFDKRTVRATLDFLAEQNEILRTRVVTVDNQVFQEISEDVTIPFCVIDKQNGNVTCDEAVDTLLKFNDEAFIKGISGSLIQAIMLNVNVCESYLLVTLHHLICDDTTKQLFKDAFLQVYQQLEAGEEPHIDAEDDEDDMTALLGAFLDPDMLVASDESEAKTYKELAMQQKDMADDIIEKEVMYWKGRLHERIQALEIPTDEKRAAVHIYKAAVEQYPLSKELLDELNLFSIRYGISKEKFFLTVFKIILMKYSNLSEINIGTSICDKRQESLKQVMGPMSNLVLLSDDLDEDKSFIDIAEIVGNTLDDAREHSVIPFDKLVMEINPENDMSRTALFDILYNYRVEENDYRICELDYNLGWGKYDYNLLVKENPSGINFIMTYNGLYFKESTIKRLLKNIEKLCSWVLENPNTSIVEADYISDAEKQYLLNEWNETYKGTLSNKAIHQVFEEKAAQFKDRIAITDEVFEITYDALNKKANRIANYLKKKGVADEDKVAIILDKSIDCLAIILGILKAGACYVPMNTHLPIERIDYMLKDCNAKICIVSENFISDRQLSPALVTCKELAKECENESEEFASHYNPNGLAYIIYTSGTTGKPKGVLLEHKSVTRLIQDNAALFNFTENDVWTMFHSYNFDFSVWEMYGCLLNGGKLVIVSEDAARDVKRFRRMLVENEVTILNQTPSAFYVLDKEEATYENKELSVRMIIFGGEALNTAKLKGWASRYEDTEFINMYGITETTIHVTFRRLTRDIIENGVNTIGKPLPTYKGYVLDKNMQLVPAGVKGEFVVGGSGVARGYLNLPELTNQKFIDNPFASGERLYRSGDLVRINADGELEYLGRIDKQVQIRGFRIEIGEIETRLLSHPTIQEVSVLSQDNGMGSLELVAFLVIKEGTKVNSIDLSNYLKNTLPDYMVPAKFLKVDAIPLTSNGKVDERKLRELEGESLGSGEEFVEATTELQKQLVEIFRQTINTEKIGIYDNYFHLGGNSILVTKLTYLINEKFKVEVPYRYFFTKPTVKAVEDYIVNANPKNAEADVTEGWEADLDMPLAIEAGVPYANTCENVLLTGATGFLGAYLLKSLLEKTDCNIYCLVRAEDAVKAFERVASNLKYYGIDVLSQLHRVKAIAGDLGQPLLGLNENQFAELANTVDEIYHNGAIALYGYSYEQLRAANVLGTAEIIKLAAQAKRKAIHYVSTVSVFDGSAKNKVLEDDIPDCGKLKNQGGYGMTKLVAEALLRKAREQGLKVNIYRPGRIVGCTENGACQTKDFLWMLVRACVEINSFMDSNVPSEMTPVDLLADTIVDISKADIENNHTVNLNMRQNISAELIREWLNDCGYNIEFATYQDWYKKVSDKATEDMGSVCAQLLPFLSPTEIEEINVSYDNSNAKKLCNVEERLHVDSMEEIFKKTVGFFKDRRLMA
ncbi:amino acid adenylation domain-containing protein/thioester reductase domain-containing protein [Pseudobutyrivibrio sp. ACV-2]|uniref:non-ribosomal peptide synthetase family protein n=1 Tax=Pseudobutyrivibrio sp. ACV-2 TaxID=1520801 RepID=UPI0008988E63|nr:thioester reductase domain-containing protein [Pseudobutyrivibrio sp. ACV-2]SEA06395.1 amino acid adenylation domain-containing protein/thioester reductase domain-containing protein [Pseudobutyrivibrio sp. ACV-2]